MKPFKPPTKFRMPTKLNLIPIRLDIDVDGQRHKDVFTWNPDDDDKEVLSFAKRTVKDLKLPSSFVSQIEQSINNQIAEFRSYEGQDMLIKEKIVALKIDLQVNNTTVRDHFLWDISNLDSEPEEFAKTLCCDLNIMDPEVGPAVAVAIREQLYEFAIQSVSTVRVSKLVRKGRRLDIGLNSKVGSSSLDLVKYFGSKGSVIRKRKEWYLYEPVVDVMSNEDVGVVLDVRTEMIPRLKQKLDA